VDGRAYWAEPRWQRWCRNLLLTLGLASVFGYLLGWLTVAEGMAVSGRVFSGTRGAVHLRLLGMLPAVVAAAASGFLAAYFLTYRRAGLALFGVGSAWGVSCYVRGQWLQPPEAWEVAMDFAHSASLPVILVGVFLLKRWHLGR